MDIFAEPEAPSEKNAGLGRSLLALRISAAQLRGLAILVRRRTSLSMRMPMLPCHVRSMASVPTALESLFVQYDLTRGNGSVCFDKV